MRRLRTSEETDDDHYSVGGAVDGVEGLADGVGGDCGCEHGEEPRPRDLGFRDRIRLRRRRQKRNLSEPHAFVFGGGEEDGSAVEAGFDQIFEVGIEIFLALSLRAHNDSFESMDCFTGLAEIHLLSYWQNLISPD